MYFIFYWTGSAYWQFYNKIFLAILTVIWLVDPRGEVAFTHADHPGLQLNNTNISPDTPPKNANSGKVNATA